MDTSPLDPLIHRWPNDKILLTDKASIQEFMRAIDVHAEQSYYDDELVIDQNDSAVIAQFATKNNGVYSACVPGLPTRQ